MGKKSAPPPPDYAALAVQQGQANRDTAQFNAELNRVNQYTPDGSLTWSSTIGPDGKPVWSQTTTLSPEQQKLYDTQNQLSQQYLNTAQSAVDRVSQAMSQPLDMSGIRQPQYFDGQGTTARVNTPYADIGSGPTMQTIGQAPTYGTVGAGPSMSGVGPASQMQQFNGSASFQQAPTAPTMQTMQGTPQLGTVGAVQPGQRVSGGPSFQTSLGVDPGAGMPGAPQLTQAGAGGVARTFDTSKVRALPGNIDDASRRRVEEALMSRINPQYERDEQALRTRLLNSGIEVGTDAYNREMSNFSQRLNDARMQAVLAGGQEESRQVGLQASLQGQEFDQAYRAGTFGQNADIAMSNNALQAASINNQAALGAYNAQLAGQNQRFTQGLAAGTFANQWGQQGFQNDLASAGFNNATGNQDFQNQIAGQTFNNASAQQAYQNTFNNAGFNNNAALQSFQSGLAGAALNNQYAQQGYQNQFNNATFNNAAADRNFQNDVTAATFNNNAADKQYQNLLTSQGFNNNAAAQQFQAQLAGAGFNNAAAQQGFENRVTGANFANNAADAATQRQLQIDQLTNAMGQSNATFNNQTAQQAMQMQAYLRQLPLNEANALRSGGQVQGPQFSSYYTNNAAAAPILDAGIAQGNYNMQAQQNAQSGFNSFLGGMANLGAAYITKSDPRLKTNITRIGTHPWGIGVYEYDIEGRRERGVMSTEVRRIMPEAVIVGPDGFDRVNYAKIGGV